MVRRRTPLLGPFLYGFTWAGLAPALLLWWAIAAQQAVLLPAIHAPLTGSLLAAVGLGLMAAGMAALAVYGRGLPMNAYPPPLYVARGVYGWISHPIYVGFIALAAGASLWFGSASGLWLVTPAAALGLLALVLGYEARDLSRRFGDAVQPPRLSLPRAGEGRPGPWERISVYLLVFLPWLLTYQACQFLGQPLDGGPWSSNLFLAGGLLWSGGPAWLGGPDFSGYLWVGVAYALTYILLLLTPAVLPSRPRLRRLAVAGLIALGGVIISASSAVLLAALHLLWPLLCAEAWGSLGRAWSITLYGWAGSVALASLMTGHQSAAELLLVLAVFLMLRRYDRTWHALRHGAERLANSWQEWRIGPFRVINHGFYTGIAGALGFWIAGRLVGSDLLLPLLAVVILSLLAAVLWAQYLEGSSILLRPLGWYGGLLGGLLSAGGLALLGVEILPLLGGLAVAIPWVQAVGRLRCLVQGCCHGGPAAPTDGIRYLHSRSRVTQIAGLAGIPVYPTQLYSILSNVALGLFLYRLWALGASIGLLIGLYLILSSAARFVEESYRAEPQTPVYARLHLYQWLALLAAGTGILFTTLKPIPQPTPLGGADPGLLGGALLVGLLGWFITGVDFPDSSRRFSRLAPADDPPRLLE